MFGFPDSAIVVTGINGDFNDSWYEWNLASSSAENCTDRADASLEEAIWADGNLLLQFCSFL